MKHWVEVYNSEQLWIAQTQPNMYRRPTQAAAGECCGGVPVTWLSQVRSDSVCGFTARLY
jgi:hypothetical protein